jgi:hypothetical protein
MTAAPPKKAAHTDVPAPKQTKAVPTKTPSKDLPFSGRF